MRRSAQQQVSTAVSPDANSKSRLQASIAVSPNINWTLRQ
jgi:hypothetical protein